MVKIEIQTVFDRLMSTLTIKAQTLPSGTDVAVSLSMGTAFSSAVLSV